MVILREKKGAEMVARFDPITVRESRTMCDIDHLILTSVTRWDPVSSTDERGQIPIFDYKGL